MANYTEHYQLHQWEGSDPFLRTDFNEDFQKIDTAIADAKGAAGCINGSYIGNGTATEIILGVKPQFIMIVAPHQSSSTSSDTIFALGSEAMIMEMQRSYGPYQNDEVTFQDTGLTITGTDKSGLNGEGQTNYYTAFY